MKIETKDEYIYITNGDLDIVLSCLGASIVEIKYNDDLLTLTPVKYDDLDREDIYYGKTIGPIANRVKDGLVKIGNKEYRLSLNENGVCNHSGKDGLSNKVFDVQLNDKVFFIYKDHIFDSVVTYKVIYSFPKENEIRIDYEVTTTDKAVLSLTNHTFFTLSEDSIDNLYLKMSADKYIENDKGTLLPISIKPIIRCLDFNNGKLITKDIEDSYLANHRAKGYDHCFFLKENIVELKSSKYGLVITTNYPCVHIYSDNYPDGVKNKNSVQQIRRAVAIEPEDNLLEKALINKDEIYQRYVLYSFKKKLC